MLEYNYIYNFLNQYGSYVNGVAQGSEEWRDITTNFSTELFKVLTNEEKYLLNKIKTFSTNTYTLKTGDDQ
jgi:hypothetical protein